MKKTLKQAFVLVTVVTVCLCGCTKEDNANHRKDSSQRKDSSANSGTSRQATPVAKGSDYTKLAAGAVLMRIGTNEITKADIEDLVNLRIKVIRFGLTEEQKNFALNRGAIWAPVVASLPANYRREVALLNWAATNGISVGKDDLNACRTGFLTGCQAAGADYYDFMKRHFTAKERRLAERRVRIEATCSKVRKIYLEKHPVTVRAEEADAFLKRVVNYNAKANATNALVWARASNIWARVKSGEDFKELAKKFTEDDSVSEEGGEWGTYTLGDLEKEGEGELARMLASTGVGQTVPPLESDNGVALIRIDNVTDTYGADITSGPRPFSAHYELSRIYFKLAQTYEISSREENEKEIRQYHEGEAFKAFVMGLLKDDGVEYPCGQTLFESAAKRAKMPQMLMQEGVTPEMLKKAQKSTL